jgi:hypothetical protein
MRLRREALLAGLYQEVVTVRVRSVPRVGSFEVDGFEMVGVLGELRQEKTSKSVFVTGSTEGQIYGIWMTTESDPGILEQAPPPMARPPPPPTLHGLGSEDIC